MTTETDILLASLPNDFFDDALTARDLISRLIADALAVPDPLEDEDLWLDPHYAPLRGAARSG